MRRYPFTTEYAKSNRSTCDHCSNKISKESLRMSSRIQSPTFDGKIDTWYHFECFFEVPKVKNIADIENFFSLRWDDQEKISAKLDQIEEAKFTIEYDENYGRHCRKCEDKINKSQIRISWQENWYHIDCFVKNILESVQNFDIEKIPGFAELSDYYKQELITKFKSWNYRSRKRLNDSEETGANPKKIKRESEINDKFKEQIDMFWNLHDKLNDQVSQKQLKKLLKDNKQFVPTGKFNLLDSVADCMAFGCLNACPECGGMLSYSSNSYECCSMINEWTKCTFQTREVIRSPFIVSEEYLNADILKNYIYKKNDRILPAETIKIASCSIEKLTINEISSKTSLSVPGSSGATIDPHSSLREEDHLYRDLETEDLLNVTLSKFDLVLEKNSFYKLQLWESSEKNKWRVVRKWGRISTEIGDTKLEEFSNLEKAIDKFKNIYLDKTGNKWDNRKQFQKHPNKYYHIPMEMDLALQDLILFIFDEDSMIKSMSKFKIYLEDIMLPGKLLKDQIYRSYDVLNELKDVLADSSPLEIKLQELSNKFYTMVPHNFGMGTPPPINSLKIVEEKCEMLDSLIKLDEAYELMRGKDSIDELYKGLHNSIEPLDKNSEEYERLTSYLQHTINKTVKYKIQIIDIFSLNRDNEFNRYQRFKSFENRMMLWHGSRRTNWASILSQGLRIAPPEAPVTGYMFGKGLYFADMVSKSANYCYVSPDSPDGLLLLCEVALGTMAERCDFEPNIILKEGEHSCKGVGQTMYDPTGNFVDKDGILYPMGKPVQQVKKSTLLYNEYIVYGEDQVRQRYLFKVKFQYD